MKSMSSTPRTHYRHLLIMIGLSFVSMFVLMYAMVNSYANVFINVNQFYMAGLMTAPMALIELVVMRAMYRDRTLSAVLAGASSIAIVAFWLLIRQQAGISDRQFLRSMIPHHASAILMCQQAAIQDAAIKELCRGIVAGQQAEIDQMKAKLTELQK